VGRIWGSAKREDDGRRKGGCADDARLVEELRRGAPEALAGLHEQYAAGIYSLALRVVRHAPDAEDITHDVLIRAYERLPRDREVVLRPWLYRLTLNRCYDHLRWSARRPLASRDQDQPSPHDPFEQSELQTLLEASLADLTRRQRAAILLKDVHGLSLVEVAGCLDLTPGSVEVLLARARRAFRASYEARCEAAGRPVPGSAVALAALPLLPLPLGLSAPPLALPAPLPIAPLPIPPVAPLAGGPLAAATGSGIGALLGLPSTVKTAVLVAAAAASVGSTELVTIRSDQRPPRPEARTAAAVPAKSALASSVELSAAHTSTTPAVPSASPRASTTPSSPTPSAAAEPSPLASPLGIDTPSPSPSATATPEASPSATGPPDPHAATPSPTATATTPSPTATATTPSPTATATPSAGPSPSPETSGSPSASQSPGP
jgi:RNA polymerase sigma factor (sigma-70 family)